MRYRVSPQPGDEWLTFYLMAERSNSLTTWRRLGQVSWVQFPDVYLSLFSSFSFRKKKYDEELVRARSKTLLPSLNPTRVSVVESVVGFHLSQVNG